jgi:hypothetical protein
MFVSWVIGNRWHFMSMVEFQENRPLWLSVLWVKLWLVCSKIKLVLLWLLVFVLCCGCGFDLGEDLFGLEEYQFYG